MLVTIKKAENNKRQGERIFWRVSFNGQEGTATWVSDSQNIGEQEGQFVLVKFDNGEVTVFTKEEMKSGKVQWLGVAEKNEINL